MDLKLTASQVKSIKEAKASVEIEGGKITEEDIQLLIEIINDKSIHATQKIKVFLNKVILIEHN